MDPFTIFLTTSLASGGLGIVSDILGAQANVQAARESAFYTMADVSALEESAQFTTTQMREEGERFKAAQRTAYLSSNIDITTGTPLKVLTDTAYAIERDIQQYRANVEQEKRAMTTSAYRQLQQAEAADEMTPWRTLTSVLGIGAQTALSAKGM